MKKRLVPAALALLACACANPALSADKHEGKPAHWSYSGHADPAHCYVTGTGLTHLGSADTRDAMHKKIGGDVETLVRGTLGRLLFSGDEAKKPVNVISGGKPTIYDPTGTIGGACSYRFVYAAKLLEEPKPGEGPAAPPMGREDPKMGEPAMRAAARSTWPNSARALLTFC